MLKGILEGLIKASVNFMFTKVYNNYNTNYKVEKGSTFIQVIVPDEKAAEALGKTLRGEIANAPVQIGTDKNRRRSRLFVVLV